MHLLPTGLVAPTQRTIPDFALYRPESVEAALRAAQAPGAVYAQGCSDLFAAFREGLRCERLVALDRVPGLRGVRRAGPDLEIGAGVSHHEGARDPLVRAALPGFARGWGLVANHRIRQRATIGGNVMARRTRYELSVMLDALEARLSFATLAGEVVLTPAALWERAEPPGGLLHSVRVRDTDGVWFGYERSLRPVMTAAVAVRGERVRLVVGSEYVRPHAVVTTLGADPMAAAARLPEAIGDYAGSAAYRRHLAGVLLGRLIDRCRQEREENR
jgi:carbon-monoxide dehydrogenase medium subunit